jgi:hypothetical protein
MKIFSLGSYAVAEVLDISMLVLSVITLAVLASSLAWLAAFSMNSMSVAIMHGLTGKKIRSLRATMRQGLRFTTRTALAWMLVAGVIFMPPAAALMLGIAFLKFGVTDLLDSLTAAPYVVIAGVAWVLYCLMNYSLVPYVALFEPHLSFSRAFKRSQQLVTRRGRLFLLSLYMALLALLAGITGMSFVLENQFNLDQSLTINFGAALAFMATNAIMVVFYRKRRLARR